MTKKMAKGLAFAAVLALLCACVCGTFTVAAEDKEAFASWYLTEDGQFLYKRGVYTDDMIQIVYIGDGTDVTVPASFGGVPADFIWLADDPFEVFDLPDEQRAPWLEKIRASQMRYLNVTFEEGPTRVVVSPNLSPAFIRINSVTLPKSAQTANLHLQGATAITVPEGSELVSFGIENVLEKVEDPQPTVIDLTGAVGLKRVGVSRLDYGGDCFIEGSVLKLPDTLKRVKVTRPLTNQDPDNTYISIDYEPMPLTIQYADGSERPVTYPGDADSNDQVNMKDVLYIRQYIAGLVHMELWDGLFELGADANRDGEVNMKDVLCIRGYISTPPGTIKL